MNQFFSILFFLQCAAGVEENAEIVGGSSSLVPAVALNVILIPLVCIMFVCLFKACCKEEDEFREFRQHEQEIPLFEQHRERALATTGTYDTRHSAISRLNQKYFCVAQVNKLSHGQIVVKFDARGDNSIGELPDPRSAKLYVNHKEFSATEVELTINDSFLNYAGDISFFPPGENSGAKIEFLYNSKWSRVTLQEAVAEHAAMRAGVAIGTLHNHRLTVHIEKAIGIPKVVYGVQDPLVKVYVTRNKIEDWDDAPVKPAKPFGITKNASHANDPLWNETFQTSLDFDAIPHGGELQFFVFDHPTSALATESFLCHGRLPLDDLKDSRDIKKVVSLVDKDPRKYHLLNKTKARGDLYVSVSWVKE